MLQTAVHHYSNSGLRSIVYWVEEIDHLPLYRACNQYHIEDNYSVIVLMHYYWHMFVSYYNYQCCSELKYPLFKILSSCSVSVFLWLCLCLSLALSQSVSGSVSGSVSCSDSVCLWLWLCLWLLLCLWLALALLQNHGPTPPSHHHVYSIHLINICVPSKHKTFGPKCSTPKLNDGCWLTIYHQVTYVKHRLFVGWVSITTLVLPPHMYEHEHG